MKGLPLTPLCHCTHPICMDLGLQVHKLSLLSHFSPFAFVCLTWWVLQLLELPLQLCFSSFGSLQKTFPVGLHPCPLQRCCLCRESCFSFLLLDSCSSLASPSPWSCVLSFFLLLGGPCSSLAGPSPSS